MLRTTRDLATFSAGVDFDSLKNNIDLEDAMGRGGKQEPTKYVGSKSDLKQLV